MRTSSLLLMGMHLTLRLEVLESLCEWFVLAIPLTSDLCLQKVLRYHIFQQAHYFVFDSLMLFQFQVRTLQNFAIFRELLKCVAHGRNAIQSCNVNTGTTCQR